MTWWERAACKGMSPTIFLPREDHKDREKRRHIYDTAKTICSKCPVTKDCLDAALREENYDRHGVRGGMSPQERSEYARRGA